jgi:protein-disulfide isomerase
MVAGQAIYEDELVSMVQGPLRQLRDQEYEVKNQALENLVDRKVLEAAAKKKGFSPEKLMEQEVDAKVAEPTEAELKALYSDQKDRLKRPFDEIKTQLQDALKQARVREARQEYVKQLREQAEVAIYLRPPKVKVAYDSARLRGNPKAPVIIVEFSDFQCPYCRKAQPILKDLLAKYEGRVSVAYRDFPLREIHPQAQLAAEASRCASEQGKFWEYHDLLFANPDKLDRQGLLEHSRSLKLDEKQFDSCLASGKYKAKIDEDIQEGSQAGVSGTPGFFINGVPVSGAQPEATFERFIKVELSGPTSRGAAQ